MRVIGIVIFSFACALLVSSSPFVGAQSTLQDVQANAIISLGATGDDLVFSPRDPLMGEPGDSDSAQCRGEPFLARSTGFDFQSGTTEWACGVATWEVRLPEGTGIFELSFQADRAVSAQEGSEARALQNLIIQDEEGQVLTDVELFPVDAGDKAMKEFQVRVAVTQETQTVQAQWHFWDMGVAVDNALPSLPLGTSFHSKVESIEARLSQFPVPDLRSLDPVETRQADETLRSKDIQFILPNYWFDQSTSTQVEIQLEVRGAFDPHLLILPTDHEVTARELHQNPRDFAASDEEEQESQSVYIPSSLIQAGGPGLYTLRFITTAPLPTYLPGGALTGLAMLAVPFFLAGLAGRVLYDRDHKNRPVQRFWRFSPLAAAVAGGLLWVWLTGKGGLVVLTQSHTATEIVWLLPLLSALTVASLLVLVFGHGARFRGRTRDWQAAQSALARERKEREEAETALYAIAHDLKSPLVALDHLVTDDGSGNGENRHRAHRVIQEMDVLVTDVLAYAQNVDTARKQGSAWVRPIVEDVVEALTENASGDQVKTIIEPGPDVRLEANAQSIHRVVLNLVGNAIKYGPDHGAVVRVSMGSKKVQGTGPAFVLEVADNGSGIAKEDRERAFALLTRLPDRQGRTLPGTGVGLAAVKRILNAQGATIEIKSAPEGGALMRVTWPPERVRKWREAEKPSKQDHSLLRMHPSASRLSRASPSATGAGAG